MSYLPTPKFRRSLPNSPNEAERIELREAIEGHVVAVAALLDERAKSERDLTQLMGLWQDERALADRLAKALQEVLAPGTDWLGALAAYSAARGNVKR